MRSITNLLFVAVVLVFVSGCHKKPAPTPPWVSVQFHTLLDSLADAPSGPAVVRLTAFRREYARYEIADTAQAQLDRWRMAVTGRYHEARELARQGEFDRAENILEELAEYFADTEDGRSARKYLEYEYHLGKAQWLLMHQRYQEAEIVARSLLQRDLNEFQTNQVETILDNAGMVGTAVSMSERASAQSACQYLRVLLAQQYVEQGSYPRDLSLATVDRLGGSPSDLRGLSAIEGYKVSRNGFSFVGVSKSGQHRIHVVDGQIQD